MRKWPAYERLARLFGHNRPPIGFWEWFLGFPDGWTDSKRSAKASVRQWLQLFGGSSHD